MSPSGIWVYKSPPRTVVGTVMELHHLHLGFVVDSSYKPIKGVLFTEKPTRQFGGVDKATEQAKSIVDGSFSFEASIGAAITMRKHGGDAYQSGLKTFVVSREGYKSLEITVGYGCPDLYIQTKCRTSRSSQHPMATSKLHDNYNL